jgi:hypothetical protein
LLGAMKSGSRGEAKRRKDYKEKQKRAYVVTPQRIVGITEHNPTQIFRKKNRKDTDDGEGEGE